MSCPFLRCGLLEFMFMPVLVFFPSCSVHFMASSNDSSVRDYDMDTFQLCKHFQFDWPVNVSLIALLLFTCVGS
jgi:hypothetical protein